MHLGSKGSETGSKFHPRLWFEDVRRVADLQRQWGVFAVQVGPRPFANKSTLYHLQLGVQFSTTRFILTKDGVLSGQPQHKMTLSLLRWSIRRAQMLIQAGKWPSSYHDVLHSDPRAAKRSRT